MNSPRRKPARSAHRGFTLIELMIAILIAVFLIGGLVTLVSGMKRASVSQGGLSELQDNQRIAMTLINDVIQSAGYFPDPTVNTAATSLPIVGTFTFAGQSIVGQGAWTDPAPGNSITVRYSDQRNGQRHQLHRKHQRGPRNFHQHVQHRPRDR